jgi:N-acetylglucosamine kinase-like BadF-type ATPase
MNHAQAVHLGIDGGATHSFAVAVAPDGRVRASTRAGSLNFHGSSLTEARAQLRLLLQSLRKQLPRETVIRRAVIGTAALFSEATPREKKALCDGLLAPARTRVVSDAMTAFVGATLDRPGVVIIAGTGSIILAKSEAGQIAQAGGWGHLVGDEGSAYWIAREAIRAAIAAKERRGSATKLGEWIHRALKIRRLADLIPLIHDASFTKDRIAGLAQYLAAHHAETDPVYYDICRHAGRELAAQAIAAAEMAELAANPLPVFLIGGVLEHSGTVRESLMAALNAVRPAQVRPRALLPVLGAALIALHDAGTEISDAVVKRLSSHSFKS